MRSYRLIILGSLVASAALIAAEIPRRGRPHDLDRSLDRGVRLANNEPTGV